LALLLLAPLPTIGVLATVVLSRSEVATAALAGTVIWLLCKVAIILFPALWHSKVDAGEFGYSPLNPENRTKAIAEGCAAGLAISAIILLAYRLAGPLIDPNSTGDQLRAIGLDSLGVVIAALLFWIFFNSIVEEYVYRWFIIRQWISLSGNQTTAILVSASIFSLHHIVGLALISGALVAVVGGIGVFGGGVIFSWLYLRHESIWPAWIAHAFADIAVFGIIASLALG
jgi:membrane protease YdiL (CAAX protease family)